MQKFLVVETVVKPAAQGASRIVVISKSKYEHLCKNGLTEGQVRCSSKNTTRYYSL